MYVMPSVSPFTTTLRLWALEGTLPGILSKGQLRSTGSLACSGMKSQELSGTPATGIFSKVRAVPVFSSGGSSEEGGRPLYVSKDGSIWQLFVLCLLALGDTVPKCYVLL